jgi:hypothetical protein
MSKFFLIIFLFFSGCGYKPTVNYIQNKYQNKTVFVEVDIDYNNASNSVYLKDSLNEFVVSKLNLQLVDNKTKADIIIFGKIASISQTQLQSDTSGYGKIYRENVTIDITINNKSYRLSNYYDFTIDETSTVTNAKSEEAIKIAIFKALNSLFSKVAISKNDKNLN